MSTRPVPWLIAIWLAGAVPAGAGSGPSPYADELKVLHAHYHTDPARLDVVRKGLLDAAKSDPKVDNLLALAHVSFIWGDVRARTREERLEAFEQGREAARRAAEIQPKNPLAHFWYATNSGRLGQTRGVVRSLFGLPAVKDAITTTMELDPKLTAVYAVAGYVFYEVPAILGGDLDKAEEMFRRGLEQDPRFTGLRVGLAKVLIKKGKAADARRELQAVLDEKEPSNLADWSFKDSRQARELLDSLEGHVLDSRRR